jgi:hypothetical protein
MNCSRMPWVLSQRASTLSSYGLIFLRQRLRLARSCFSIPLQTDMIEDTAVTKRSSRRKYYHYRRRGLPRVPVALGEGPVALGEAFPECNSRGRGSGEVFTERHASTRGRHLFFFKTHRAAGHCGPLQPPASPPPPPPPLPPPRRSRCARGGGRRPWAAAPRPEGVATAVLGPRRQALRRRPRRRRK